MQVALQDELSAKQLAQSLAQGEDGVANSLKRMTTHCVTEFGCAMAFITALDETSQYILAVSGADEGIEFPEFAFCRHTIANETTFYVADAIRDERFRKIPAVTQPPFIRSYLGVPINDPNGYYIGTFCLIDPEPDFFTERQVGTLASYAKGIEDLLRLHRLHMETKRTSVAFKETNDLLADANRMFREAEKAAKFGAWQLDIETQTLTWSDGVYAIHGLPTSQPITVEHAISFYEEGDQEYVRDAVSKAIETGEPFEINANLVSQDGIVKRVRSRGELIPKSDTFPARLTGIFKDITESYQSEIALRHAADHDSLTELYNRHAFDRFLRNRLAQAKASGDEVYLLLIDLDGFKDVNDTSGHVVGDIVLEETGRRIASAAQEGCISARWGGDEFALVLPEGITGEEAQQIGALILESICQRTDIADRTIEIGATAGLASSTDGMNAKELVRRADTALFHGKKRNPGTVHCYTKTMERKNIVRQRAIAEVRSALDEHRLFAGYQPVVDLKSGEAIGFEALMRLTTRGDRRLTASEVLPALLDTKLSREVCRRMLEIVAGETKRLESCVNGLSFLSINASEADLLMDGFADRFSNTMADAGVDLSRLTLEVTETVLLVDNSKPVQRVLWDLRERGVRIALDDFGTGYSSLSHLRHFPIDKVKIDCSFVRALGHERHSRTIVQALIGMAKSMDIDVVAEGIETEAQRKMLDQMGCRLGQGYLFGAAEDIGRLELALLNNQKLGDNQSRAA